MTPHDNQHLPIEQRATFHLGDLLSYTTGALVAPDHMRGMHRVAEFLTDGPVWDHQLIRLSDPIAAEIRRQHPWISAVAAPVFEFPDDARNDHCAAVVGDWLTAQAGRFGAEHVLARPDGFAAAHIREPLSELIERVGPERVIPAVVTERRDR